MPQKYLYCPACNKEHVFSSMPTTSFNCLGCGAKMNPSMQDLRSPYKKPNTTSNNIQSFSGKDYSGFWGFLIAVVIMGFIVWATYFSDKSKPKNTTLQTQSSSYQSQTYPSRDTTTIRVTPQSPDTMNKTSTSSQFQLCSVRLVNTLNGTDKTGGFKAQMNDTLKTLTLTYLNNPKEIIELDYQGNGIVLLKYYDDGEMQIEKTMYRRIDLETNDNQIYTSKTEEVQLTIMPD